MSLQSEQSRSRNLAGKCLVGAPVAVLVAAIAQSSAAALTHSLPYFSPDGPSIAFLWRREGGTEGLSGRPRHGLALRARQEQKRYRNAP
jgi:hypothetical protein